MFGKDRTSNSLDTGPAKKKKKLQPDADTESEGKHKLLLTLSQLA